MSDTKFYNCAIENPLDFNGLILEISNFIKNNPWAKYNIVVGTDSPGVEKPRFTTAISILRIGNGGRYFWTKSEPFYCPSLQERIYKEAMQSITLTQELKSRLKDSLGEDFFWDNKISIHLDIGTKGPTKDLIEQVVGMVKGFGFEAVIKPNAFCACVVADRHT
jgi:hypothetical protein